MGTFWYQNGPNPYLTYSKACQYHFLNLNSKNTKAITKVQVAVTSRIHRLIARKRLDRFWKFKNWVTYLSVLRHSAVIILAYTFSNLSKWAPRALNYRRSGVACVPPSAKFAIIKRPHAAEADFEGSARLLSILSSRKAGGRAFVPSFSLADAHTSIWPRIEKRRARILLYSYTLWVRFCCYFASSLQMAPAKVVFRLRERSEVACLWRHLPTR